MRVYLFSTSSLVSFLRNDRTDNTFLVTSSLFIWWVKWKEKKMIDERADACTRLRTD